VDVFHPLVVRLPAARAGQETRAPDLARALAAGSVSEAPWSFLRGCIRSDGCAFVNRTGRYEYVSYEFANLSSGILDVFEATCRRLGLHPRRYETAVRLYRRGDVAQLVDHVGLKR
jgi:hypothetical protein